MRTALSQLTFSLTIIKTFEPRFFWVGLMNCILAVGLIITSILRHRMTIEHNEGLDGLRTCDDSSHSEMPSVTHTAKTSRQRTSILPRKYIARSFHTAGHIVLFISSFVLAVEGVIIYLLYAL